MSGCKIELNQGRYTWRHDNIVKNIADSIDTTKYSVSADIEGYRNATGGTLDPALAVTLEKPDLFITDTKKNTIDICELTAGHESNIDKNHKIKDDRYAWMLNTGSDKNNTSPGT